MENLVRWRYWWIALSAALIIPGLICLAIFGLRPGIDFAGGTLWDIQFLERTSDELSTSEIANIFAVQGFESALVQLSSVTIGEQEIPRALVRTPSLDEQTATDQQQQLVAALAAEYGEVQRESIRSVGPTVSQDSTRSAFIAVAGACLVILIYLTIAFRRAPHPVRYGICAILAMLHDVVLVMGVAAILGLTIGLEVDALFLTALLTIISFSVHDTIVVFDRIRENLIARQPEEEFDDIVNRSIVQTIPRSVNTQLTTLFTLTALLLFGGETIFNFVLILMIGLISGTYSSIFNAAQLLVIWEHQEWQRWFGRREEPAPAS
ncbi:MAG: protein translocase subunit SecF [Chloroflexi bacterium AL-W]|nr:protein translocase subunit SecF [Chloroflexi bacterium AL-N1]NOK70590.1 protein translocase subunit SecF [Chloroflexi bacterium AL-N10]NOK77582.1 protein translocase subunit SecF [Chloroflexi bacterium AL-N5]NOK84433.1 protein translocase subunit SecF [Chloroflexi bacterium AL-W]NOK92322.1 protein translocase subunit SecF [Chloroflexi bacterium AL-N15]